MVLEKTMLMKMILGFVSPSSGSIKIEGKVLGKDISMPDRIGAIDRESRILARWYPGFKNLKFLAMIHHKISNEEIRNAMRMVGLDPDSKKHVGKYSLGMRQRLGIAQAIMEDPDILLLDEPLNGLDNEGVEEEQEQDSFIPEGKRKIDHFGQSFERRYTNPLRYGISDGSWGKLLRQRQIKPMGTERGSRSGQARNEVFTPMRCIAPMYVVLCLL